MKKLLLILLMLPFFGKAQTDTANPYKHFYLENNEAVFKNIYDTSGLDRLSLRESLLKHINSLPHVDDVKYNDSTITGKINGWVFPYKQFGQTLLNTHGAFKFPIHYNFIVDIKDNKYRVKLTGIYFDISGLHEHAVADHEYLLDAGKQFSINSALFRNKNFDWRTSDFAIRNNINLQNWLFLTFKLKNNPSDNW
jgi:hypothetical protein